VGAVVTLMGLLAMPSMLKAGYDTKMAAGAITAGGCLGILIPPSVLLIVYGATAGVSVVQLYAGAFFPGIMLASLYVLYIIIRAKLNPKCAPPLSEEDRKVPLSPVLDSLKRTYGSSRAVSALVNGMKGRREGHLTSGQVANQFFVAMLPALFAAFILGLVYSSVTAPPPKAYDTTGLVSFGSNYESSSTSNYDFGFDEPAGAETTEAAPALEEPVAEEAVAEPESTPAPLNFWIALLIVVGVLLYYYARLSFERLEVFKMLLTSFFPLAFLIMAVLGSIVFGFATPSEAAAVGAFGGLLLAAGYRQLSFPVLRESAFLTSKTTAMVCWLFVGSSIFSAAFALLGGQELVEQWVLSLGLTPIQFLLLSQVIIFLLGWPLEWTEIIVIFMPIFIPLLPYFDVDPLFFGLLVAMNLQTAFLSPPVAMAAFYLKGVSPPGVTLNQIFLGMIPFMFIQIFAMFILYVFPQIGMWLPGVLYR
jgi:TRAP-type mannitol/chloroaromatic compound transport system permease large subunit